MAIQGTGSYPDSGRALCERTEAPDLMRLAIRQRQRSLAKTEMPRGAYPSPAIRRSSADLLIDCEEDRTAPGGARRDAAGGRPLGPVTPQDQGATGSPHRTANRRSEIPVDFPPLLCVHNRPLKCSCSTMEMPLRGVPADTGAVQSEPRTFEDFYGSVNRPLFGALCVITGNRTDAEDISQEAFLRVWERWERVALMDSPEAFLFRTAMNVFRNRSRRARLALRRTIGGPDPRDELAEVEERDRVERALRPLTSIRRQVGPARWSPGSSDRPCRRTRPQPGSSTEVRL